jgi:hypothetical protein
LSIFGKDSNVEDVISGGELGIVSDDAGRLPVIERELCGSAEPFGGQGTFVVTRQSRQSRRRSAHGKPNVLFLRRLAADVESDPSERQHHEPGER